MLLPNWNTTPAKIAMTQLFLVRMVRGGVGGGRGVENNIQLLNDIFWVMRVAVVNDPVSCCLSRVTTSKTAT